MKICGTFERTCLFSFPYILLVFVILPILGHASADSEIEELEPRKPLVVTDIVPPSWSADAEPEEPPAGEEPQYRLTVKFRDDLKVRALANGGVTSTIGKEMLQIASLRSRFKMQFKPLIPTSEDRLSALEERGRSLSKRQQPDLAGMMIVDVPGASKDDLLLIAEELNSLEEVEYVYFERLNIPPPGDISPTTPDLTGLQTYFDPDPGIDVDYAWSQGWRGGGIRLSDCEYGWVYSHEDLVDKSLHPEPGQTPHPDVATNDWDEHGTAVMGELVAVVNAYGVSGMVPDATIYTYPEWTVQDGGRRVASIANAIADSSAGDIVLLEMQAGSPLGPAETDPSVWAVVKAGTDAGVIVVAAAGNGNADLDTAYTTWMGWGDSGAIIVGGGTTDINHDHLSSSYGSRVNVQGWYTGIFTLGYGNYAEYGGDKNQRYRSSFGGTSGASPFVAAAAVAIQDKAQAYGERLTPKEMRYLLIETGIPQGSGGHVGPFPNLRAALDLTDELARGVWVDSSYSGTETGSFEEPYNTVAEGVAAAPTNGYVNIKSGSTSETPTITKAVSLIAWGGSVYIGI